eukprot:CAMPEP_0117697978 /NCGR_PEP_ID=MMETSP0804-20121206/29524_1 /TAXON_ID=1074897 /ORGANISM="Tetraselmis astigmatica, Strain CCMP880" /LENGTH=458 /DNA_ID=CAMNT_0005512279 /DNA_START=54 /DNA_END=1430 /DNA_ORIENTATION=-
MAERGCSPAAVAAFERNYQLLVDGTATTVPEADIDPVVELPRLEGMPVPETDIKAVLSQTAVLKLNGGLGTSMGLEKAKSLLEVKDGKAFLDLIAEQIKHTRAAFDSNVKFILMNSFSTSEDTKEYLKLKHSDLLAEPFIELMQNMSPKIDAATLGPASYPSNPDMEWCPPGHGDIYPSLLGSGMLEKLLAEGVKYLFVSNSDNLGATLSLDLLMYFASSGEAFLMEVCERSESDKKGGHLAVRKSDGKFILRESAMCPKEDSAFFEDITRHKFFNTNNLWVNLEALNKTLQESGGVLPLPLIKNSKTVNPRDSSTQKVFQLETAMGSAIECFANAGAIVVPRSRFSPVKTCNELFMLRSDAFKVTEASTVELAVEKVPLIKMDDKYYKLVDKMEAMVEGFPSLAKCTSLKVEGPVKFAKGITLVGDVIISNGTTKTVTLQAGVYTGKVEVGVAMAES